MPKVQRVFEVTTLLTWENYHSLKHYIYIADKMPVKEDISRKPNEEIAEIKEVRAEVIIK